MSEATAIQTETVRIRCIGCARIHEVPADAPTRGREMTAGRWCTPGHHIAESWCSCGSSLFLPNDPSKLVSVYGVRGNGYTGHCYILAEAFVDGSLSDVEEWESRLAELCRGFYWGGRGGSPWTYDTPRVWRAFALYAIARAVVEMARRGDRVPNWFPARLMGAASGLEGALVAIQSYTETRLDRYMDGQGESWHEPWTEGLGGLATAAGSAGEAFRGQAAERFYGALEAVVGMIPPDEEEGDGEDELV